MKGRVRPLSEKPCPLPLSAFSPAWSAGGQGRRRLSWGIRLAGLPSPISSAEVQAGGGARWWLCFLYSEGETPQCFLK